MTLERLDKVCAEFTVLPSFLCSRLESGKKNSSDPRSVKNTPPISDMGTLALDADKVGPDIYSTLGLKESGKEAFGSPRVLSLLSTLLERSVHINEVLLETAEIEDPITVFHGVRAPTLSIRQYIERIFKYSGCSPSCFVVANIYVDRLLQQTDIHLTTLNVHRILITSIMLAAKFIDDAFFNNAYYARVGGVSTSELNRLELKFLFSIDFRLQVTIETFGRYCSLLEKEAVEGLHIERLIQVCRIKETWSNKDESACVPTVAR